MTFAHNFWNTGICDFSGFEKLCQRMREGKRTCKDYIEFLKQRAHIQEMYGKALIKLVKVSGGQDEIGTLRQSWEVLRAKSEGIGMASLSLCSNLLEEATSVAEFVENSWLRKKQAEENVRKMQNARKASYKKVQEMKRMYFSKCREAEFIGQTLLGEMGKIAIQPKELDKLKQKHTRLQKAAEQAEEAYRASLASLEEIRVHWERETETACELFQELEASRIRFLRNSFWTISNLFSRNCISEDEFLEIVRNGLEKCSEETDIAQFIRQKRTGTVAPAPVPFEPYRNDSSQNEDPPLQKARSVDHMSDVPLDTDDEDQNSVAIYATVRKEKKPDHPVPSNHEFPSSPTGFSTNDVYDSLDLADGTPNYWKVVSEYTGEHDYEISLKKNDRVRVLRQAHKQWWWVERDDGQGGYYPAECLKPVVPPKIGIHL